MLGFHPISAQPISALAAAAEAAADDPETRFLDEWLWHGHDDAVDELLQQIIEDAAVAADDPETRDWIEQQWHGFEDAFDELVDAYIEDSVEFILIGEERWLEGEEFDHWVLLVEEIGEPPAPPEPGPESYLVLFESEWQPDEEYVYQAFAELVEAEPQIVIVSEWIVRARRRGRR